MSGEKRPFFVIECVRHNHVRYDMKERKDLPTRLYLFGGIFPMSPDVIWLASVARQDSGTYFTTDVDKAVHFETEGEADNKIADLTMADGYLPADLMAVKIEPKEEDEHAGA